MRKAVMASNEHFLRNKPPPPPKLSKENVGVWTGWCCKGDREVAREAAAKGIHVDLVIHFLSVRRKTMIEEAQNYFRDEVFTWVKELLDRKQIFRVTHILKNIQVDPHEELLKVFYTTTKAELREYIGYHLKTQNKLEENLQNLWKFLDLILRNNLLISQFRLPEESIECLDKQNSEWKSDIAAKLFLRTYDISLSPFITGEALWKQLLVYNDVKLLKIWANLKYSDSESFDISDNLSNLFHTYSITEEMINLLNSSETSPNTSNVILNELAKFGIFCDADIDNFSNVLTRFSQAECMRKIFRIIKKSTANLTEKQFLDLLLGHCTKNNLYGVLSICVENFDISEADLTESPDLDLIFNFRKLTQNFCQENLCENILKVSRFLSTDSENFYKDNPLILLSLMFFAEIGDFSEILAQKSVKLLDLELTEAVANLPMSLKTLGAIANRKSIVEKSGITCYGLIEKHYSVDAKKLFAFRFQGHPLPHFGSQELIAKYGYSKQLNYQFYLKQSRPSIACKRYLIDQYRQFESISEANVRTLQKKVYKIALRSFGNLEISSSCVAFLEMIGINSTYLKVALGAASIVYDHCRSTESVIDMFMKVESDPGTTLEVLETLVMNDIDVERFTDGSYFVQSMTLYDIVVNFTVAFSLKLPEMFLRACASNNMWLPFLILAQLKNYPVEQIKPIVQSFKNPSLLEHVYHSVLHDILVDDQNVWLRDSRTTYLSRIGVRKSMDNLSQNESVYSSLASQSSYSSNSSSAGSDFLEIDISNTKATLLQTLIRCHNSTDPPRALLQACQLYRNPLLAIFATSYEPDSVITNWLTWLAVSSELYETFTNFESVALCAQDVSNLLENCMKHGFPKTLLQSFKIFIPTNPLKYFVQFLNFCIDKNFDKDALTTKVNAFKNSLQKCRRYSVFSEADHEMTYLNNKVWLEAMARRLLSLVIEHNIPSLYEQIQLVESLCKNDLDSCLECPELRSLLDILKTVYDSKCETKFDIVLFFDQRGGRKAVVDCIDALINNSMFEHALKIAETEGLPVDLILIKQWRYNYENIRLEDTKFWLRADEQFKVQNVTADCVIDFYLSYVDVVQTDLERYQLLKLAYDWARRFELSSRYNLEKRKWLAYVALEEKWKSTDNALLEEIVENVSFKEITSLLKHVTKFDGELPAESVGLLKALINDAMNAGNLWLALKVEKMFGCGNANLDILKLCFGLAEGLILPYQLSTEQRLMLTKVSHLKRFGHRRALLSARASGVSPGSHSSASSSYLPQSDYTDSPVLDTLAVLGTLAEKLTGGVEMGQAIFMTYRISLNIEIPYHLVVSTSDSMKMLKDALEDDCMNKLEVVHDFLCVYKWSKEQIADFICEEIINAVTKYIKSKSDRCVMWDLKLDQDFPMVLQLLQDNCSVLGYKIYSYASAMHKSQLMADLDFRISELALVIELLVISHDCFTADCNMEGISIILKKCQAVVSHLLTLRSWKLIVRLLTGVGRYMEMNYVFQILRENDQFEYLLRKGSRKDNGLKTALLEYLKKYCPDNKELYKIVGLHFTLFSEVALLWEREAQSVVRNVIAISRLEMQNNRMNPDGEPYVLFGNTDGTRICLNKAIENYTHATEFHLQGGKLAKAMNSAKQAELIALQMSLLKGLPVNKTAVCLLNLTQVQVVNLISNELSFDQTLILVQAYNYQPDWSSVLFEQCVVKNNLDYLQSYMKHRSLSNNVVHDISRKFLAANLNGCEEINSMKSILHKLPSVHTKYRIASELGFMDVVEDLIQGGQLAYLKDTVWKRGYKS